LSTALASESFLALVALEETIGVRESRLACPKGFQGALRNKAVEFTKGTAQIKDPAPNCGFLRKTGG
jgi:hypothetical protein